MQKIVASSALVSFIHAAIDDDTKESAMKSREIFFPGANSSVLRVRKRQLKIKCIARYALIALGLIVGALTAAAATSGHASYSGSELQPQIARVLAMDTDSMIRMIRSMSREKLMSLVRSVDPHALAQVVRAMDHDRVARLIQAATDAPSLVQPGSLPPQRRSLSKMFGNPATGGSSTRGEAAEDVLDDRTLAVIIHPSNPVAALSKSELRMIFSGQVNNWGQLGGPDLPLELMASGAQPSRDLPWRCVCLHLATSPFSSVIVAGVAETRGALGIIPANRVQEAFLGSHAAVKKITIKKENL